MLLRCHRESDEFLRSFGAGLVQTTWNCPRVEVVDAAVPHHFQVAFLLHRSDPTVVGRAHDHVTGSQVLRRLGACLPPLDVRLEFVELLEGTILAIFAGQHFVDIFRRNAVGHQGKFQGVLGAFAQATLAWELLGVPEIRPTGRRGFQFVGVVGQHGRPHEEAHAARLDGALDVVFGLAEQSRVQLLEHVFVTTTGQLRRLDFHQVPRNALGVDHGLDLGHFTVVFASDDLAVAGRFPRCVKGFGLSRLVSPTKRHHSQVRARRHRACRTHHAQGQGCELQGSQHLLFSPRAGLVLVQQGAINSPLEGDRAHAHARLASQAEPRPQQRARDRVRQSVVSQRSRFCHRPPGEPGRGRPDR